MHLPEYSSLEKYIEKSNFHIIDLIHVCIIVFIYHDNFVDTNIDDQNLSKDFLDKINLILEKLVFLKKNQREIKNKEKIKNFLNLQNSNDSNFQKLQKFIFKNLNFYNFDKNKKNI